MTPFFSGWLATMWAGVRPIMFLAAEPTATTLSVFVSTATTEGSESTTPRLLTNTNVFAVPKSIATSGVNSRPNTPILATEFPTLHPREGLANPESLYTIRRRTRASPGGVMRYLRCTIGRWNVELNSEETREAFRLINDEGLRVFRSQPGFVRYRLMVADSTTTIAVAEWESEELGKPGAQRYWEWLKSSGIAEKLSLETYDGPVVVAS